MPSAMAVRPGRIDDAVDGIVPAMVAEPGSGEEVAALLADASRERQPTVMRGGGTKGDWGQPPAAVHLLVRTARLDRVIVHRHADLTATTQAGIELSALNAALAQHGQWLPVESAFEGTTVGGLIATNDAGPSRHRYGTPRDLLIGATLALADGRLVTSGGHVVKNVAGYDLGRLVSGSHGSLAAITEATFKLLPLPQATATLVVACADAEAAGQRATALGNSQLDPLAFDVHASWPASPGEPYATLFVRFASSPGAVRAQVDAAFALAGGERVTDEGEAALWRECTRRPWTRPGAVVRLAWLPAALSHVLTLLDTVASHSSVTTSLAGRVGVGTGLVALDGAIPALSNAVARLRASADVGHVTLLRAPTALKRAVSVWGPPPSAFASLQALKHMFDPAGILNAGRGPI
jgi:glycolate oxidase FAD binding subunit